MPWACVDMTRQWRLASDRRGTAAVEFALVMPLFVLIVTGIFTYGVYFGTAFNVESVAAEAARAAVGGLTPSERSALAQAQVSRILGQGSLLDPGKLQVEAQTATDNPDFFDVRLRYDSSALAIWAFEGLLPMPPRIIERAAVVRRGGY